MRHSRRRVLMNRSFRRKARFILAFQASRSVRLALAPAEPLAHAKRNQDAKVSLTQPLNQDTKQLKNKRSGQNKQQAYLELLEIKREVHFLGAQSFEAEFPAAARGQSNSELRTD